VPKAGLRSVSSRPDARDGFGEREHGDVAGHSEVVLRVDPDLRDGEKSRFLEEDDESGRVGRAAGLQTGGVVGDEARADTVGGGEERVAANQGAAARQIGQARGVLEQEGADGRIGGRLDAVHDACAHV
jgi:hypothetical protein